ncbi:MAG: hypothetical protein ACE5K4_10570 [Candidatus Hydrothermarchaeota archaeon]
MNKRIITFFFFIIFLGFHFQSIAQFTPEELAERAKWEEFLKTAEITSFYQKKGREAVTEPWVLTLEKDGITRDALWKNPEGRMKGYIEGWKWEIAAYRLDKYLGLNMVSPTVERRFQGDRGSCQLWVEYEMKLREKNERKIKIPSYKVFYWNRAIYLQRAFDNLIGNEDRHAGNILITKDWRMILIDHSRSFRSSKKFTKELIFTEKHKEGPKLMRELPRAFVEKIKALNFELIKDIVGEYLKDKEINAVLTRKELILKEIDKLIQKQGEDKVLY